MKVIFVNGNIGAGKETIILHMEEILSNKGYKVKIALEPVQIWRETGILEQLYKGEYFTFQKFAILSRVDVIYQKYQEALVEKCDFLLIETNPLVDLNVYAKTTLTANEFGQYISYWQSKVSILRFSTDCNVFLDVSPEVSMARIATRARSEESKIQLSYLRKLYYAHLILNENIKPIILKNDCAVYDNAEIHRFINICLLS